ncbi:MAG: HAD family hydrolase [Oscillospiraceae bacterium]
MDWIFFDLGSTLIDESDCERQIILDTVRGTEVSFEEFEGKMAELAGKNESAYSSALRYFGLEKAKWNGDFEKLYPCSKDVLKNLSGRYILGIIANQNPGLDERLKKFGIYDCFEVIASSSEVGAAKPSEEIFRYALRKAQCKPENSYMVGDRLDNDIAPAQRLGMKTVWVKQSFGGMGNPKLLEKPIDIIIENISQISEYL